MCEIYKELITYNNNQYHCSMARWIYLNVLRIVTKSNPLPLTSFSCHAITFTFNFSVAFSVSLNAYVTYHVSSFFAYCASLNACVTFHILLLVHLVSLIILHSSTFAPPFSVLSYMVICQLCIVHFGNNINDPFVIERLLCILNKIIFIVDSF